MHVTMHLSNAIRQRIIELMKDMNFADLSKVSDVRYTTLISFMNGKNKTITLNILYNLCTGLKINLYDFFNCYLFDNIIDEHEKNLKVKQ